MTFQDSSTFLMKREVEQDLSLLEEETVIREHTRKKKATHEDLFKGLKVEKVVIPLPEEDQVCPVCGTPGMVLIGEEYVRRELEFIPAYLKVIEYYSQSYGCPSCKEGLGDTEKPVIVSLRFRRLVGKGPSDRIHCCMDDVSEVRQWTSPLPSGERLETVWCPDQQDDAQLDSPFAPGITSLNV